MNRVLALLFLIIVAGCETSQPVSFSANGKLFIIGGGDRTPFLMEEMKRVSGILPGDTIGVLPMAGEEPDSSFWYFKKDIPASWGVRVVNLNFSDSLASIDQLKKQIQDAKILFICGGDQKIFMQVVSQYNLQPLIERAYQHGATIAGTSAGAAVMSEKMITGDQIQDTAYSPTYPVISPGNGIYHTGLGFIKHGIIDQHFIVRSRYNRIWSAQLDYPELWGMGIDESTAAVFYRDSVEVVGHSYVTYFAPLKTLSKDVQPHMEAALIFYRPGEKFKLLP